MILLSGGHYEDKPGARYRSDSEYPNTFRMAINIHELLTYDYGIIASIIPPTSLNSKTDYVNKIHQQCGVDLAVEIHLNSAANTGEDFKVQGSETLFHPKSRLGRKYAKHVQNIIGETFTPNRGIKEGWFRGDESLGVLGFLRYTRCPALVLEPEFIQNVHIWKTQEDELCRVIAEALSSVIKK